MWNTKPGLSAPGNPETGGIPEGDRIIKLPPRLDTGREARLAETLKWIRRFD